MGIIPSRNLEEQRREKDGIVYFDRGVLEGRRTGAKYDRYAIQTHFVQRGRGARRSWCERYVLPLSQPRATCCQLRRQGHVPCASK